MKVYIFREVLNELISYFLLGDLHTLKNYKDLNQLPDNLAKSFTTTDIGDNAVAEGIVIPLANIVNYPYTIIFNLSDDTPILLHKGNDLQVRQSSYILRIESCKVFLYSWRALENFTNDTIEAIKNKPSIELENGWYKVEILGGQTKQPSLEDSNLCYMEPTLEFIFTPIPKQQECTADIYHSYKLHSDEY